jgi:flagellar hook-associated protein 3 FlgL
MGDTDDVVNNTDEQHFFYLRGTKSDGSSFKEKIQKKDTDTVEDLMDRIGAAYGNTNSVNAVDVTLNSSGEIVIEDKLRGSSKLDFHLVGAVDFTGGNDADVTNLDDLYGGESNFVNIINGDSTAAKPDLYIKEFTKSGLDSESPIEGITYDRANFTKDGSRLSSNSPQILKSSHYVTDNGNIVDTIGSEKENAFAEPSTLLSEVADTQTEILPSTTPKTYTLAGSELTMTGVDINGNDFDVKLNLDDGDSSFTVNGGTKINIYNVDGTITDPDKVTYQQLMDVMNMATTGVTPTTNSSADYQAKIKESQEFGETSLSYDGKIGFRDMTGSITRAEIALYDTNTNDFGSDSSIMTFNSNNSLTIRDPKTDFFKSIDEAIKSVENYSSYPDSDAEYGRTLGVENAIEVIDDLSNHVFKTQSISGAQSNTLTTTLDQTNVLEISTISLRSSVIDTDMAEASVRLSQLNLNYEAMLSTVGKVSKLSLVNYL